MKKHTRFLSALLATVMIAGSALTATAARFNDVTDNSEHRDAIDVLTQLGVLGGYEDGTFRPDNNIERDEMAKMMFVLKTTFGEAGNAKANFHDTNGNWAEGYIAWCDAEDIVGGYEDKTFRPDNNITYDEALKMICAALGYTDFDSNKWPVDVRLLGIKELGLNAGLPATLNGNDQVTRAQVAQMVYNALFVDMKETKTVVHWQEDVNGNLYQIPVQVNKQLASDIWNFTSYVGVISATEHYALEGSAATEDSGKIVIKNFVNNENGADASELDGTYEIADLGLENCDEYIGREIKIFYLDNERIENTSLVYGSTDKVTLGTVKKGDGSADDIETVTINGKKYDIADIWYKIDENGKISKADDKRLATSSDTAYNTFPVDSNGSYISGTELYEILLMIHSTGVHNAKNNDCRAIDSDGDGEYDYLFVTPRSVYEVDKIGKDTLTYQEIRGSKKTVNLDLIKGNATLKEGDVFTGNTFGEFLMIDSVINPVETYVSKNSEGIIYLANNPGQSNWNSAGTLNVFYGTQNNPSISGVGKDSTNGLYYIVDRRIVLVKGVDTAGEYEKLNTAVLVCAEGETEWEYNPEDGRYYKFYPVILNIGGKETKVNVGSIDGETIFSNDTDNVYGSLIMVPTASGYANYANLFVSYTVDEDGLYHISTNEKIVAGDSEDELLLDSGYEISFVQSTGVYKLSNGTKTVLFELDENSLIYYIDDNGRVAYYTSETIPEKFVSGILTESKAYFTNNGDTVKTLVSVMMAKSMGNGSVSAGENDPKNHMLMYAGTGLEDKDGKAYYVYRYLVPATGEYVVTNSVLPKEEGAVSYGSGTMVAYKENGENTTVVKANDNESLKQQIVIGVREKGEIIFTDVHPDGFAVKDARITKINVAGSAGSYHISGSNHSDYAGLVSAYEEAVEEERDFTILYGYDTEAEKIVYILYGENLENVIK